MKQKKKIICLANSWRKDVNSRKSGRCVAGKELFDDGRIGDWIRPVLSRDDPIVRTDLADKFQLLDVISMTVAEQVSHDHHRDHHRENFLVEDDWKRICKYTPSLSNLTKLEDSPLTLWSNDSSSDSGMNDRVPKHETETAIESSLYLIKVQQAKFFHNPKKKSQIRACFLFKDTAYGFSVTDSQARKRFPGQADSLWLCVSLAESGGKRYGGYCYKLIAGIIRGKSRQK